MITYPNAKVNLGLNIYNKREDGFHNMETILYPLKFSDILEIVENKRYRKGSAKFDLQVNGLKVEGSPDENLVSKAYQLMESMYRLPPVSCCLYKSVPMGAGLGGGSSDAAFILKLLNVCFELRISDDTLESYAAQLGSDCAFFIRNRPAYVFGKGHELEPIELNLQNWYLVLLNPGIHSSTALAYRNAMKKEAFDPEHTLKRLVQLPVESWKDQLINAFEASVFSSYPVLQDLKAELYKAGAVYAAMSGSGASIFGLFHTPPVRISGFSTHTIFSGWL